MSGLDGLMNLIVIPEIFASSNKITDLNLDVDCLLDPVSPLESHLKRNCFR